MSQQLIETFFPAFLEQVKRHWLGSTLWNLWFPTTIAERCPEVVVTITSIDGTVRMIRQPALFIGALVGIVVGIGGSVSLWRLKRHSNQEKFGYWCVAFFTFGLMNATAIFLHGFYPPPIPDDDYPTSSPWLWMWDCYFTGVSSTSLILASVQALQSRKRFQLPFPTFSLWQSYICLQLIGIFCIMWFCKGLEWDLLSNATSSILSLPIRSTLPLELWYLLPALLAGIPLGWLLYESFQDPRLWNLQSKQTQKFPFVLPTSSYFHGSAILFCWIVGPLVALGGIPMDATLCLWLQNYSTWDAFTAGSMMFWGCDVCFIGLYLFLLLPQQQAPPTPIFTHPVGYNDSFKTQHTD